MYIYIYIYIYIAIGAFNVARLYKRLVICDGCDNILNHIAMVQSGLYTYRNRQSSGVNSFEHCNSTNVIFQ